MKTHAQNFKAWQYHVQSLKNNEHLPIIQTIAKLRKSGKTIFPPDDHIFSFLHHCKPRDVSVVILGQDPYHKQNQAHGLAFSVLENVPIPPSLRNIFKEINSDIYKDHPAAHEQSSNLIRLATQGVLLLNTILTVEEGKPLSHAHLGWQNITTDILNFLAHSSKPLVVMLWGNTAKHYSSFFTSTNHLVLLAAHPSPLSASRGFFGCRHFSKANTWLIDHKKQPIIW